MNAYFTVFRMRWKMELQYRGAVIGGVVCQVFFGLILVSLYRALYASKPQTMPIEAVASYVWLQQAFFRMQLSSDSELMDKIRTGGIAYDLCRPLDLYGYYYVRILAQKLLCSLLRAAPMLVFAFSLPRGVGLGLPVSLPALAAFLMCLTAGLLCTCALENLTMAFTMRTLDSRGVQAMLNLLMMILSGNVLPLTLYPDSWQKVITLLPYAQVLDTPIRIYTGQYALADVPRALLIQLAWVLLLVWAGESMWRRHQKRLIIQGG